MIASWDVRLQNQTAPQRSYRSSNSIAAVHRRPPNQVCGCARCSAALTNDAGPSEFGNYLLLGASGVWESVPGFCCESVFTYAVTSKLKLMSLKSGFVQLMFCLILKGEE